MRKELQEELVGKWFKIGTILRTKYCFLECPVVLSFIVAACATFFMAAEQEVVGTSPREIYRRQHHEKREVLHRGRLLYDTIRPLFDVPNLDGLVVGYKDIDVASLRPHLRDREIKAVFDSSMEDTVFLGGSDISTKDLFGNTSQVKLKLWALPDADMMATGGALVAILMNPDDPTDYIMSAALMPDGKVARGLIPDLATKQTLSMFELVGRLFAEGRLKPEQNKLAKYDMRDFDLYADFQQEDQLPGTKIVEMTPYEEALRENQPRPETPLSIRMWGDVDPHALRRDEIGRKAIDSFYFTRNIRAELRSGRKPKLGFKTARRSHDRTFAIGQHLVNGDMLPEDIYFQDPNIMSEPNSPAFSLVELTPFSKPSITRQPGRIGRKGPASEIIPGLETTPALFDRGKNVALTLDDLNSGLGPFYNTDVVGLLARVSFLVPVAQVIIKEAVTPSDQPADKTPAIKFVLQEITEDLGVKQLREGQLAAVERVINRSLVVGEVPLHEGEFGVYSVVSGCTRVKGGLGDHEQMDLFSVGSKVRVVQSPLQTPRRLRREIKEELLAAGLVQFRSGSQRIEFDRIFRV